VHALSQTHGTLTRDGVVVDTQPVAPRPPIESADRFLGWLDQRRFQRENVGPAYRVMDDFVRRGLFTLKQESEFDLLDEWDDPRELVGAVSGWRGTDELAPDVRERVLAATPSLFVRHTIRLCVLRKLSRPPAGDPP
jgi:hypothetical protein